MWYFGGYCVLIVLKCVAVFELDRFVKDPDAQQLLRCTKRDLCLVAEHYDIGVQGNLRKEELCKKIIDGLIE